jgi:GMP synthase (glutamine-hydrolysing)
VHRAVGDQLTCVFVDHGLMRKNEGEQVVLRLPRHLPRAARGRRRRGALPDAPAGVSDPERKRKLIGTEFIRVFEEEAAKLAADGDGRARPASSSKGTLYSDVIESGGGTGAATIKSHHNVGGLPGGPRVRARRAPAGAVQGRGPRRGRRARPARAPGAGASRFPAPAWRSASSAARPRRSASTSCATPTRSCRTRSARPASTASCGSPSASCPDVRTVGVRATSAPTATSSSSGRSRATMR